MTGRCGQGGLRYMPSLKGPKQHGPPETGLGHGVGLCLLPASPGLSDSARDWSECRSRTQRVRRVGASLTTFTRRHPHSQHLRSVTAARGQRLPASGPRADTHKTPQPLSRPCGPAAQSTRPRSSLRLASGSGSFSEFVGLGSGTMTWCSHCRSAAGCVPCGRRKTLESNRRRRSPRECRRTGSASRRLQ